MARWSQSSKRGAHLRRFPKHRFLVKCLAISVNHRPDRLARRFSKLRSTNPHLSHLAVRKAVKKIVLWRMEDENKPETLASIMEPPAKAGADFKVVMGYRHPTAGGKAAIEIFPIAGKELKAAWIELAEKIKKGQYGRAGKLGGAEVTM